MSQKFPLSIILSVFRSRGILTEEEESRISNLCVLQTVLSRKCDDMLSSKERKYLEDFRRVLDQEKKPYPGLRDLEVPESFRPFHDAIVATASALESLGVGSDG